ncbi:MAG: hypothetical protein ACYDCK_11840 [Thermoplasmatota archaeon]
MALVFTLVGALGVAALALCWTMAALVYFSAPAGRSNRALAVLLVLDGVGAGSGNGLMFLTDSARTAYAWQIVAWLAFAPFPAAYLYFVSTVDVPATRWLRARVVRIVLALYAAAAIALVLAATPLFVTRMIQPWYAPWDAENGPLVPLSFDAIAAVGAFGFVAVMGAFRRAKRGTVGRTRSLAYGVAFGFRDATFIIGAIALPALAAALPAPLLADNVGFLFAVTASATEFVFVPLLAYGILKTQLFDIDLKVKVGLKRGTLAAAFVFVFLVVAQVAQNFLAGSYGWLAGGVAAALLLFALRPLERAASRVADAAMPRVTGTSEYVAFRKLAVYRAALEGAYEDGEVTTKERAMLARLVGELQITESDASAIEEDVRRAVQT